LYEIAVKEYSDPFSASKFGAAVVTVTVQEGLAPANDTLADVFDEPVKERKRKDEDDETMLERIQRQSSKKPMPPKKKKKVAGSYAAAMENLHIYNKKGKAKRGSAGYGASRKKSNKKKK
jgi:hypothetical protein